MRPETELTKWSYPDLQDQAPASHILILATGMFYIDHIEVGKRVATASRNVGEERELVLSFNAGLPWTVTRTDFLETYTVSQAREADRKDIIERTKEALERQALIEKASEEKMIERTDEEKPKARPINPPKPDHDAKLNEWLRKQLGSLGSEEETN